MIQIHRLKFVNMKREAKALALIFGGIGEECQVYPTSIWKILKKRILNTSI